MPAAAKFVGLDVGGTTMKAAVVDDTGTAAKAVSLDTFPERGQEAGLKTMCDTIEQAVKAAGLTVADVTAIGVATPGLMDIRAGLIDRSEECAASGQRSGPPLSHGAATDVLDRQESNSRGGGSSDALKKPAGSSSMFARAASSGATMASRWPASRGARWRRRPHFSQLHTPSTGFNCRA